MAGLRQRITRAIRNQPQPTVTVLSSLLRVEDELGYIPKEAVEEVAELNGASINDVWAVVSFYPNFRTSPPGQHRVEVCWGPTCHLVGAMPVIAAVLEVAGLVDEGDTPDGQISLRYNTCLGACAQAPVISIDHQLAGRVSPQSACSLLRRALAAPEGAAGGQHTAPHALESP